MHYSILLTFFLSLSLQLEELKSKEREISSMKKQIKKNESQVSDFFSFITVVDVVGAYFHSFFVVMSQCLSLTSRLKGVREC